MGEQDLDTNAAAAALDGFAVRAEQLLLPHGAASRKVPGSCAAAAAQARELLRLLLVGQASLSDAELCSALAHVCGMLGSAWDDSCRQNAPNLVAQIRWEGRCYDTPTSSQHQ